MVSKGFTGVERLHKSLWIEEESENRCRGQEICYSAGLCKQAGQERDERYTHSE